MFVKFLKSWNLLCLTMILMSSFSHKNPHFPFPSKQALNKSQENETYDTYAKAKETNA